LLAALFAISSSNSTYAQDISTMQANCGADVHQFCRGVEHNTDTIRRCLLSNKERLSARCKAIFPEIKSDWSETPNKLAEQRH